MKFILYRVTKRIKSLWAVYLFVFLQVTAGTLMLAMGVNYLLSAVSVFRDATKELEQTKIIVECRPAIYNNQEPAVVNYQDYKAILEKYSTHLFVYYMQLHSVSFIHPQAEYFPAVNGGSSGVYSLPLAFVTKEQFEEQFGVTMAPGHCYAGKETLAHLSKFSGLQPSSIASGTSQLETGPTYVTLSNSLVTISDTQVIFEDNSFIVHPLPEVAQEEHLYFDYSSVYDYTNALTASQLLYFPLEELPILTESIAQGNHYYQSRLELIPKSNNSSAMLNVLDLLYQRHDGKDLFSLSNHYLMAQKMIQEATQTVKLYTWLAVFELVLVTCSLCGILYLIMQRRKRDLAISIMSGATFATQVAEFLLEISIIIFAGTISGIGLSLLFMPSNMEYGIYTTFHIETVFLLAAVMVGMVLLSTSLSLWHLRKISPIAILQNS